MLWHTGIMTPAETTASSEFTGLYTNIYGTGTNTVLALHGLTGHGRRWEHLQANYLPEFRFLAPDLRGHGFSTSLPPWTFEANVNSLLTLIEEKNSAPIIVIGHSFGGAIALHLANARPDLVRGLVLLDPAVNVNPTRAETMALDELATWKIASPEEAKARKRAESWWEVTDSLLDTEISQHLIEADGYYHWRYSQPMFCAATSELARPYVLPPSTIPTIILRAQKVQPPFQSAEFIAAISENRSANVELIDVDCDHMVPFARPDIVAQSVRAIDKRS